jgi:hypothetical protein
MRTPTYKETAIDSPLEAATTRIAGRGSFSLEPLCSGLYGASLQAFLPQSF